MDTKEKIQIAVLLLIFILIIVLIMAIIVLAKNVDVIKSNPVQYAIDNEFYDSCACYTNGIHEVIFQNEMVIKNWTS